MIGDAPICYDCRWFHEPKPSEDDETPLSCAAYPDGIPHEIIVSDVDHNDPYPGDGGRQFEAK